MSVWSWQVSIRSQMASSNLQAIDHQDKLSATYWRLTRIVLPFLISSGLGDSKSQKEWEILLFPGLHPMKLHCSQEMTRSVALVQRMLCRVVLHYAVVLDRLLDSYIPFPILSPLVMLRA